jgi:hydrogenase expression/formation protein HypD
MDDFGMKYIDEYRDKDLIRKLICAIKNEAEQDYTFMEVCGGHTNAIHRFGIPSLLPGNIRLISGPGCPVCVTDNSFIDNAVVYSRQERTIITTFGDLIRVPGTESSLEKEKAAGADIRIVYSPFEAIETAKLNSDKKIIFLGIGFETTTPGTAITIKEAERSDLPNFFLLSAHKIMPPAIETIIREEVVISGFICPGHVATITGSDAFTFISERHNIGCVITGFEPVDILHAIYMLVKQVNRGLPSTEIQYTRAVTINGNTKAQKEMSDVFEVCDMTWRGFGTIPGSGLRLNHKYEKFDIENTFPVAPGRHEENKHCICGAILRGIKIPADCSLFAGICIPENPVGACMVSSEGACNAYYKYRINE